VIISELKCSGQTDWSVSSWLLLLDTEHRGLGQGQNWVIKATMAWRT